MKRTILLLITALLLCGCVRHVSDKLAPEASPENRILTRTAIAPSSDAVVPNADDEDTEELITRSDNEPWSSCADGSASLSISSVESLENEEYRRRVQITLNVQDSEAAGVTVVTRCMNGVVYVCNVTADQRCMKKLNETPEINEEMMTACAREELNGVILPDSITDANAAYEWTCKDGQPTITAKLYDLDEMGFIKDLWQEIPAP